MSKKQSRFKFIYSLLKIKLKIFSKIFEHEFKKKIH